MGSTKGCQLSRDFNGYLGEMERILRLPHLSPRRWAEGSAVLQSKRLVFVLIYGP